MDSKYKRLIEKFPLLPIETTQAHAAALEMLKNLSIRDSDLTDTEVGYGKVLTTLIQKYEQSIVSDFFDEEIPGNEILEFLMEQHAMSQVKAAEIAGVSKQKMNDFLKGRQGLAREARVKLAKYFKLPQHLFELEILKQRLA